MRLVCQLSLLAYRQCAIDAGTVAIVGWTTSADRRLVELQNGTNLGGPRPCRTLSSRHVRSGGRANGRETSQLVPTVLYQGWLGPCGAEPCPWSYRGGGSEICGGRRRGSMKAPTRAAGHRGGMKLSPMTTPRCATPRIRPMTLGRKNTRASPPSSTGR